MKINFGIDGLAIGSLLAATMLLSGGFSTVKGKEGRLATTRAKDMAAGLYAEDSFASEYGDKCLQAKPPSRPVGKKSIRGGASFDLASVICNCDIDSGGSTGNLYDCSYDPTATRSWNFTGPGSLGTCTIKPCRKVTDTTWVRKIHIQYVTSSWCSSFDSTNNYIWGTICTDPGP